jgi:hypothetical protein
VQPVQVDPERTTANDVIQIGDMNVVIKDAGKGRMVFGNSVNSSIQKPIMPNVHEASSNSSSAKYFQQRWCPPGLTHTQKRKLQHLQF